MEEPNKYWSRKWKLMACKKCGRDKYGHEGKGLCVPCYQTDDERQKRYRRKRTEELERLRRLEATLKKK